MKGKMEVAEKKRRVRIEKMEVVKKKRRAVDRGNGRG